MNVVSPGPIATPIYGKLGLPKEAVDAFAANIISQVPLKRFGTAEEVAQTGLYSWRAALLPTLPELS